MGTARLVGRVIGTLLRFFSLTAPWVWRFAIYLIRQAGRNVFTGLAGTPAFVDGIAVAQVERAVLAGFPTRYDQHLYWSCVALAYVMLVGGWITLSYLTVGLVSFLLRAF